MKFNCFEIGNLLIGQLTYEQAKAIVTETLGEDWRIPTRGEFLSMLDADVNHNLDNYTGKFKFWLADANDSNCGYIATPVGENEISLKKADIPTATAECVFGVKYDVDLDYICNDARIDDYCIERILRLYKKHDITGLDISFYYENGIEIPNGIIQENEYDDNIIIGITSEESPIDKADFCIYCNNGKEIYLRDLHTGCIINIMHTIEECLNEVDSGELPLMKY
jgi:hypothetical protein